MQRLRRLQFRGGRRRRRPDLPGQLKEKNDSSSSKTVTMTTRFQLQWRRTSTASLSLTQPNKTQGCGLVAEAHAIDERMEWRTFANEGDTRGNAADPNRVGGPTNPLLKDGLTTSIQEGAKGGGALASALQRTAARAAAGAPGHESDRALLDGMRRIGRLTDDLQLVKGARDRACQLYSQVLERAKGVRSRGAANVAAAVVYIACRQEGAPRTFKEIVAASAVSVAANANSSSSNSASSPSAERLDKRDIARAYKAIVRDLEAVMGIVHAGDLTRRFCSQLGVPKAATRAAAAAAEVACPRDGSRPSGLSKPWDGKSPLSQAAAIIYLVTRCPGAMSTEEEDGRKVGGGGGGGGGKASAAALPPPPVSADIALVAGVTESTMRSTARDMFPDLREIVPGWFATDEELRAVEFP